jgi:hypothetical protein
MSSIKKLKPKRKRQRRKCEYKIGIGTPTSQICFSMASAKCLTFFLLWTFGAFLAEGNDTAYSGIHRRFTAVPEDIPSTATEIWLNNNRITSILQTDFNDKSPE